jgi:hypothetical protein
MKADDVTSMVKMDFKTLLMIDFHSFFNQIKKKSQIGIEVLYLHFSLVPLILNLWDGFALWGCGS